MADNKERNVWCVKGGNQDWLGHYLFLTENVVALDEPCMPDLSQLPQTREMYKAVYQPQNTHLNAQLVGQYVAHLFKYVNDVQRGDLVVYPSRLEEEDKVYIGEVQSDYFYVDCCYRHRRRVDWHKQGFPRADFSRAAIGQSRFAAIKKYAGEFTAKWESR